MNCFGARLRENICVKGDCLFHPTDPAHFSLFISTLKRAFLPKFQQFLSLQRLKSSLQNILNHSQYFSYFMKPLHHKALTDHRRHFGQFGIFFAFLLIKDFVISAVHV